jgi:TilS substrate binding domain
MTKPPDTDSWDDMRSRTWDNPDDSLQGLLGALGAGGLPIAEQQAALRRWLDSAAACPAPERLLAAVHQLLAVDSG